ncbi:MAG: beta-ketoacyl-[Firmicutes bacterium]|nr:beta-ketoacyl-[acyl-carrier-protein] synthase II [Bacillota bacterium]
MTKRIVVITGVGAVTPVGNTAQESFAAALQGECGIAPISAYDASAQRVKLAAEVKNLDIEAKLGRREAKRMDRFTQLALIAAAEAMADSGLNMDEVDRSRIGVLVSSGIGGLGTIA